jgi:uncharacterized protein
MAMDEALHPAPGPTSDDRSFAMAVHLGTLVSVLLGGWGFNLLVPLVGYLWKRERPFVAEHAREQLNFQLSLTIYAVIAVILAVLTIGLGLLVLVPLAIIVALVALFAIIRAAIAANRGESYRFPLTMRLVS